MAKYILLPLLLVPSITEYLESGSLPNNIRELITDIVMTIFIAIVIAVVHQKNQFLENLSLLDHLTGIGNRRQFDIDLQRETLRAQRLNLDLCVIFFDLDDFKMINDKYGHDAGDKILITFAQRLLSFSRKGSDYCYRFGGDEFALLLTDITSADIDTIYSRIEEGVTQVVDNELPEGVSASNGIVFLSAHETYQELLKRADSAMYRAKRSKCTNPSIA